MKKFLALLLSLVMVLALVACGDKKDDTNTDDQDNNEVTDFKVGFIMLHDENSTYDLNFINAAKEACETLGVEYTIVTNVPEGQECYDKAAELADAGCNIIFADSFGHEDYMIQAAKDFPDVQFCHSTGTKAHTEGLSNYHNAFAYQPARRLHGRSHRLRDRRCSRRFLQRFHRGRLPQHLSDLLPHRLGSLL